MPVFHTSTRDTTPRVADARAALKWLEQEVGKLMASRAQGENFERFERELHALFVETEREVLAEGLQELDIDVPQVQIGGELHRQVLRSTETYMSAVGPVRVRRTLYRAVKEERAVVPLELRAGIVERYWTPLAARQAAYLVAHLTAQESEGVLRELGNMRPSKSSLDRLPKGFSGHWEEERERFERELRAQFSVPKEACTMAVSLDGVMVPMKDGARAEKRAAGHAEGKHTKGPAGFQEVGCGTLSFFDANGERLETLRFARMPQSKKATLKAMLSAEIHSVLGQRPDLTLVKLADGAKDNWEYLSKAVPEGIELIDFYHAAEQLKAALDSAYGDRSPAASAQFEKLRHRLRHDPNGVDKVIRALAYLRSKHPRRSRIAQVLGYFRRHRHRLCYAEAKSRHLPIGSGVVEAACKTLATQRMKRSGMRWRHAGGQAILTLRALIQSERFDQAWGLISKTYRTKVTVPDNVVTFPRRRLH